LPAIALLPGLCVMGLVGGMARTILMASASGEELPPAIPELKKLTSDCLRFGLDALLLPVLLLGPAVLLYWMNVPFLSVLPVPAAPKPVRKPAPAVSAGELAQARAAAAAARPAAPPGAELAKARAAVAAVKLAEQTTPPRPAPQKPASAPAPKPATKPASAP